ncbi:CsgG/HfaB family protein [candidate division KSB1 bacterium]
MKIKKILLLFFGVLVLYPGAAAAQITLSGLGAQDYFRVKSALLPRRKTFDFRINTLYQSTDETFRVGLNAIDTVTVVGPSTLAHLQWALNYSFTNSWELSISGITYYDANQSVFRYGAGDTRVGFRFAPANVETQFNWSAEVFAGLPTGFDSGDRLVRAFASKKINWGGALYTDFIWNTWTAKVNATYFHAGGRIREITDPFNSFWYDTINGVYGISPNGEIIQSSQANVGVGLSRNFFFNTSLFSEYYSYNIFAQNGDGKSLGNFTAGMNIVQKQGFDLKLGIDMPLGELRPNPGFFIDLRMNGIIGGRRVLVQTEPIISEEEPSLVPGRKPFFRRGGVVYSRVRDPIRDTVFIIDGTPSMLGRGTLEGSEGEDVTNTVTEFIQTLIDSIKENSNISVISYSDEVTNLSWRTIDESKKEEVKNSVNDIPDQMNTKADELEQRAQQSVPWQEKLEEAIARGYEDLAAFERSDYNKIHLQRIIIFSDGLDESTMAHDLEAGFRSLQRRYQLSRDDFRFIYYLHTQPRGEGARLDDNVMTFVEQENGKVFRTVDISSEADDLLQQLNFNGIDQTEALRYQSQITSMAVLDFNTKGLANIKEPLIKAFNTVFDYNDYFVIKPQGEIGAVRANEGLDTGRQPDLADLVRVGRRLGVDYVVYGEILNYQMNREGGLYIPYFIGLPKTELSMDVAIRLVDVAEGTLGFVRTVSASASRSDGFLIFPSSKENRLRQLSGVELAELQMRLMENWSRELRESMFEDRTVVIS